MRAAAAAEEFEQATLERNRLRAVHSLLERRRVANESVGTLDAVAVAVDGREANAQVFQVRDGVLSDRQSFYLSNETERDVAEVAEEFMLQFYAAHISIPPLLIVQRELVEGASRRRSPRRSHSGAAGRSSCARPSAARSAGSSSWQSATRVWRSTRSACAPSAAAPAASRRSRGCSSRWDSTRRRSGSSASTSRTSAARRRSPRWSCSRAARRRSPTTGASRSVRLKRQLRRLRRDGRGARPALRPVGAPGRHLPARPGVQRELRRAAESGRDRWRQGTARGRPRPAARLSRARCCGRVAGQADRGGVHPRALRSTGARPLDPRAAAAAARARRGAPLRDHPPPHAARQRDDEHRCSTSCPASAPRASVPCSRISAPRTRSLRPRARSSRRCPACRRRSRANCTATCTEQAEPAANRLGRCAVNP